MSSTMAFFKKLIVFITLAIIQQEARTMYIPEDIEILDGYEVEEPASAVEAEYYPQDLYFEARSLSNIGLTKAIRNKRSPLYHILESPGLRSHFHFDDGAPSITASSDEGYQSDLALPSLPEKLDSIELHQPPQLNNEPKIDRQKRSEQTTRSNDEISTPSILPTPEKQVMDPDYYRKSAWTVQTFNTDYSLKQDDDDDAIADASSNNEGMKGRTPRVNFITQPRKPGDENIKDRPLLPKLSSSSPTSSLSSSSLMKHRYEKMEIPPPMPDMYPSRSYEPYLRRYDRYDDQFTRYDPYYEDYYLYRRRYDPYDSYSPRIPSYPEPYYDYPDSRYDTPEPRDYRPMYSNEIYERPPYEPRNHRIIYYAHLPEIVRPPSHADTSYGWYGRDSGYIGPISGAYKTTSSNNNNNNHNNNKNDNISGSSNRDGYGFVKREKKDYRNYYAPVSSPPKSGMPPMSKQNRE